MNAGGTTPSSQSGTNPVASHIQLVQAALQASNAAAALGLMTSASNAGCGSSAGFVQSTAGPTPQGSSPTGSVISTGNPSQSAYSTLQNQQQQVMESFL